MGTCTTSTHNNYVGVYATTSVSTIYYIPKADPTHTMYKSDKPCYVHIYINKLSEGFSTAAVMRKVGFSGSSV